MKHMKHLISLFRSLFGATDIYPSEVSPMSTSCFRSTSIHLPAAPTDGLSVVRDLCRMVAPIGSMLFRISTLWVAGGAFVLAG